MLAVDKPTPAPAVAMIVDELPFLTDRQLDFLVWIYQFWVEKRRSPSHAEICAGFLGVRHRTATSSLRPLREKGYVITGPARYARTVRLTEKAIEKLRLEGRLDVPQQELFGK